MRQYFEMTVSLINEWSRSVWLNSRQEPEIKGPKALRRTLDFILLDGELWTTFKQRKSRNQTWQGGRVGKNEGNRELAFPECSA